MKSSACLELVRALILWLILATTAGAQSPVEVRSPSAKLLETAPGRIITASVVVANRSAEADEFSERLSLPEGCQRVAPPEVPFRLEAGGQIVRILAVMVPATMPAGQFSLRYTALSRRDPSAIGSFDFAIQVVPVDNLEIIVEPRPDVVIAGDAYFVKLRVTNRGNSRLAAQLAHCSSLGFTVTADASSFPLEAGASREIICRVQTDKAFASHTHHAVTFDVTATSVTGKPLSASQASVAELVPRASGNPDPFHHLPMQLRLTALAETGHALQFQAELSGAGSLDEAGMHQVDFVFRGPDVQNASLFGERDEYGASYRGQHWGVDLGDRTFALSPLTEKHTFGRGAGVKWHDGKTSAGLFFMTSRFRRDNTEELGAFVRQDFTGEFGVQANFLRKTGAETFTLQALPQNIVTLETQFHVQKLIALRLEAGASRSDDGVMDAAFRAEARGELPGKLSYAVEHTYAGPDFHGYYSDTEATYATVAKSFSPKLRAHASYNRYAGNLALNDVRSSVVNRENSWNIGGSYSLSKATEFSLEQQHVERNDILLPAAYDFTEDSTRLGVSHNFGKLQLRSSLDLGTLDNSLTGENGPFQRYNLFANWQPSARQTYSVFASYGPSAFTGSSEKALSAGVSARWQVRDHLTADLSYARNQYDGLAGREQDQLFATLRYQFENKHTLSVVGRWSRASTATTTDSVANEAAVFVTYSIPLSVPVARKRSIGALQGRLCNHENGTGVPRAVLQIGERFAVTDDTGHFDFHELKPGPCELRVVPDSLGPRLTMATALPMKLKIRPAETTRVALAATPACSLTIRVTRFEFADGQSLPAAASPLREAGGVESATVEISNGRDTWRAQTDRTGTASFDRLAPGRWSIRVAASDLPAHHTLENAEQFLTLTGGSTGQLALRVLPQRRTLRLLDHGTIR